MLTTGLAKGRVLTRDGIDLSGEGMGFGAPVVVTGWRTYLSFTAEPPAGVSSGEDSKIFQLDALQKIVKKGKGVEDKKAYIWQEARGTIYKKVGWTQKLLPLAKRLEDRANTIVTYERVEPLASVPVEYGQYEDSVRISVNLTEVRNLPGRKSIYILNEQDALEFPVYIDSSGKKLEGSAIGGWVKVDVAAASFRDRLGRLAFELEQRPGAVLYRGRELIPGKLSWSGLIYDVSRYQADIFTYTIKL